MNFSKSYYVRGVELFAIGFSTGAYAYAKLHIGPLWLESAPPWGRGADAKTVFEVSWVRTWHRPLDFVRDLNGWI